MKELSQKRSTAISVLLNFHRALRDDIANLPGFKDAFDIPAEAELAFHDTGLVFLRSTFFDALRELYANPLKVRTVVAQDGRSCRLALRNAGDLSVLSCTVGEEIFELPGFPLVSVRAADRLAEFDRIAASDFINDASASVWRKRLEEGHLSDGEVSQLMAELRECPIRVRERIRGEGRRGEFSISTIVPRSRRYFQRLVGPSLGLADLADFVSGPCAAHVKGLQQWDRAIGFGFALLLGGGHSTISALIDMSEQSSEDLVAAFQWLADRGDRFSQIAGLEIGIRLVGAHPGIEDSLLRMLQEIKDEDITAGDSRFALSASLFVLVDGELSRRGLMRDEPPYWRRLAALAQAALFERELVLAQAEIEPLTEWAKAARGVDFFIQSLVDLRREPRWFPDFMSPKQLKDEAISRVLAAAAGLKKDEGSEKLRALLTGDGPNDLRAQVKFPMTFLPGPLEGGAVPVTELPDELVQELLQFKDAETLSSQSLAGLVNSALVFRLTAEHSRLAGEALKKVRHQVALGDRDGESFSVLIGLATVAAVTRAPGLAEDVRILARVLRRRPGTHFDVDDLMRVGLIASAANYELGSWCASAGIWFAEIAQEDMSVESAARLRHYLRKLSGMVPDIMPYVGRADAALAAVSHTG